MSIANNKCRRYTKFCFKVLGAYLVFVSCIQFMPEFALAQGVLDNQIDIDIAANTPLEDALIVWGTKAGVTLLINTAAVDHRLAPAVHGRLSARNALSLLLRGSGLSYSQDSRTIRVIPEKSLAHSALTGEQSLPQAQLSSVADKILTSISSANSDSGSMTDSTAEDQEVRTRGKLDEVIVTAQKRSEELLEVPASVSVISGEDLQALHVESLSDMSYYVPGMTTLNQGVPGSRILILRGLFDGGSATNAPLVGVYVNDLPVSPSTGQSLGGSFGFDLNPYDIDHVEVLQGPQGTLYGANTLGGLVKYVLKKPNLKDFEATVGSNIESVYNSDTPSWGVRGAVSAPIITDVLAFRVSAFDRRDAGYLDNQYNGEKGFNATREAGGLATLLWTPNERVDLKAMAVVQSVNAGSQAILAYNVATQEPYYGCLCVNSPFVNPEQNETHSYSLSLNWRLDFATLTSSTGWTRFTFSGTNAGPGAGALCVPQSLGPTYTGCPDYPYSSALVDDLDSAEYTKFVQEVRLASPDNQRLQWLVGGFFTHETNEQVAALRTYTAQAVRLPAADNLFYELLEGNYKETAGFADLTFKVSDRFDVTGGGRYTSYSIANCTPGVGGVFAVNQLITPSACQDTPSTDVGLWMANARFHVNSDSMLYARAGTGYRPGSGCPTCGIPALGEPGVLKPDETTDFEVGFKGSFLENRLRVDTSLWHILWRDMQISALNSLGFGYPSNAGRATSDGWELSSTYLLTRGLTVTGTVAHTHAYFTTDAPALDVFAGTPLAGLSPFTGSLRVDYQKPLSGGYSFQLGGDYRYRDAFHLDSYPPPPPLPLGYKFSPQNLFNLYAGVALNNTALRIYGTNLFNRQRIQEYTGGGTSEIPFGVPMHPRTVGLSLDYKF